MPKPSQISVKYKGGYRGSYIDIHQLIDRRVKVEILDFCRSNSKVSGCDFFCRMQIRISGKLFVTWHSSEVLTQYLNDCKESEMADGISIFPIEDAIFSIGDDRAYYLIDASEDALEPVDTEIERMIQKAKRNKR